MFTPSIDDGESVLDFNATHLEFVLKRWVWIKKFAEKFISADEFKISFKVQLHEGFYVKWVMEFKYLRTVIDKESVRIREIG